MNFLFIQKFCLNSVKWLFYIAPFLTLYVSANLTYPYITGRNFLFRIIVEIALVFWIGLVVLDKEYRPRFSKSFIALLVFVVVVFVADVFGANFYASFWSSYERMSGFLNLLHLAVFAVILGSVFRAKEWRAFANLIFISSLVSGLWGVFQLFGLAESIQGGERISGTMGNPTYFATYLMLASFIALALFWNTQSIWLKRFYGAGIAYEFLLIYFSQSRGVILSMLAGAFVFLILYLLIKSQEDKLLYRKYAWGILGFLIVLPLIFISIKDTAFVKSSKPLSRLAKISLADQTVESRVLLWKISANGFKELPILGWGQENFNLVFNKYYLKEFWKQETWFDHPHNTVLGWLLEGGILGLLAYLSLFAVSMMAVAKAYKGNFIGKLPVITFFAATFAYFSQNLLAFDSFGSSLVFFAFLGFAQFLESCITPKIFESKKIKQRQSAVSYSISALSAAGVFMLAVLYFINYLPLLQSKKIIDAVQLARSGTANAKDAADAYKKAISVNTFGNKEAVQRFAELASDAVDVPSISFTEKKDMVLASVGALEKLAERYPDDIRIRITLASSGYAKAALFDQNYIKKAEEEFEHVIGANPLKQVAYVPYALFYFSLMRFNDALLVSERMLAADPEYPYAHYYNVLGNIYVGKYEKAKEILRTQETVNNFPYFLNILQGFEYKKKLGELVMLYEDLIKKYPENGQYHANLAAVYFKAGTPKELVIKAGNEAMRLDPDKFKDRVTIFEQIGFKL